MILKDGDAGTARVADDEPLDSTTLGAALDWLLHHEPPLQVMALSENGIAVPMPAGVPVDAANVLHGKASALDYFTADDLSDVVDAWDRARRTGASSASVHLTVDPERLVTLHFMDGRPQFGVYLGFLPAIPSDLQVAAPEPAVVLPRLGTVERDELSVVWDADEAATALLGRSREELIGTRLLDRSHPEDRPLAIASWMEMLARPGIHQRPSRLRYRRNDGRYVWLEITNDNRLSDKSVGRVVTQMVDVTEQMEAIEKLRANEELLRRLTEALPLGVVQIDAERRIVHANERLRSIVGVASAATVDEQFARAPATDREKLDAALDRLFLTGAAADLELSLDGTSGSRRCSVNVRSLSDDAGVVTGAIACVDDVTDRVRMREELRVRATFDDLTLCYNRPATLERLTQLLKAPDRRRSGLALLFVDLDRFKETNDRFGHAAGDELLRVVGQRLLVSARESDIVGRLGGDEFLVVLQGVATPQTALEIAERTAAAIALPVDLGGRRTVPRSSIGVAWTNGLVDADTLVARADTAMYEAKRRRIGPVLSSEPDALVES